MEIIWLYSWRRSLKVLEIDLQVIKILKEICKDYAAKKSIKALF